MWSNQSSGTERHPRQGPPETVTRVPSTSAPMGCQERSEEGASHRSGRVHTPWTSHSSAWSLLLECAHGRLQMGEPGVGVLRQSPIPDRWRDS